jgi:hypothetical protein
MMRPRLRLLLTGILVLLVAGHTVYWFQARRVLAQGYAAWTHARRAAGWTIASEPALAGGWPLAVTLTAPDFVIAGSDPEFLPGGINWSAERLVLRVALAQPRVLRIEAEGAQHVSLGGGADVPYTADRLRLELPIAPDISPRGGEITAQHLRAGLPSGPETISGLTIDQLSLRIDAKPAAPQGEALCNFSLSAQAIGLPPDFDWALGPRIEQLTLEGALDGPLPRGRGLAARAAQWRDGGGALEVRDFSLDWGPLDLSAKATLALDDRLQPMGTGTARLTGFAATLNAMADAGVMPQQAATLATAMLTLLSHAPDDDAEPEVEVPLTLQGRTLSLRKIPLARLPTLDWPAQ